jgi:hypothetical protein
VQQMPVAVLRHPPGAREMTVERPPGAIGFAVRIKMQDYAGNFTPVGAFCVGVEQTQIRDEVFLVIGGQYGTGGCGIDNIWIKRRDPHGCFSRRLSIGQLCSGLLGILMTSTVLDGYSFLNCEGSEDDDCADQCGEAQRDKGQEICIGQ